MTSVAFCIFIHAFYEDRTLAEQIYDKLCEEYCSSTHLHFYTTPCETFPQTKKGAIIDGEYGGETQELSILLEELGEIMSPGCFDGYLGIYAFRESYCLYQDEKEGTDAPSRPLGSSKSGCSCHLI